MKYSISRVAFGLSNESLPESSYIYNKKTKKIFCNTDKCGTNINVASQSDLLLLINYQNNNYDKNNVINKINLLDVDLVKNNKTSPFTSPTTISTSDIPYLDYLIDPSGNTLTCSRQM